MDALAGEPFDGLLAELPQPDAVPADLGMGFDYAEDVAPGGVAIHAEQQIRRRQIEEAEGVRLHDLRQVQNGPQAHGDFRNAHGENGVAGLGRGDQVADGANAADARHERGHLIERPALAELFEPAELRHVEIGLFHAALFVQVQRDLGMALDAGDRVDYDFLPWHCLYPNFAAGVETFPSSKSLRAEKIRSAEGGHPGMNRSTGTASCTGRTAGRSAGTISRGICGSSVTFSR